MQEQQTDANRVKEAFNHAKARYGEYIETQKRLREEKVQAFYEKTVEEIYEYYNSLIPPFKIEYVSNIHRIFIPETINSVDALSIFMDHGFDVSTEYNAKNKCYLVFNFATK